MSKAIWAKLNLKDQTVIYVVRPPKSFASIVEALPEGVTVRSGFGRYKAVDFSLAFVQEQKSIGELAKKLNIASLPTLMVIKNGALVESKVGLADRNTIVGYLTAPKQ